MRCILNCIVLLLFIPALTFAQDKQGKVLGVVTDSLHEPIPYATISLLKKNQTKDVLKRTFTNKKGAFELVADTGSYFLSASHISTADAVLNIRIKAGDNSIDTIVLGSVPKMLENVVITVRKPLIEVNNDKIIYNVESDPAAKAETATDILRKTPSVTVDGDGNVQLNGQSNFKILLNGRETSLFALNVKEALKNFPGAVISKIEVISSPSAKYDAEGVGGVINIVTKKKVIGYNAYVNSTFNTLSNYTESISFDIKMGKLGISTYLGTNGSLNSIRSENNSETTPLGTAAFSRRSLSGNRYNKNRGGFGNIEITYDIDSFRTITAYGNLGKFKNNGLVDQLILTEFEAQPSQTSLFFQDNLNKNGNSGIGGEFTRRFRRNPEQEFSFRFNGQFGNTHVFNNSFQDNPNQDRYVSNESLSKTRDYTLQIDYEHPLKEKHEFEIGIKGILRSASSDFVSLLRYKNTDPYVANPSNSDRFGYHQEVYGIYTSYDFPIGQTFFRTGLRFEYTNVHGDFAGSNTVVDQGYSNLIPNFFMSHKFTPVYTLTAAYNMRLQRPYITTLNPYINNTDSLNISFGNPNLGPQVLHSVSLQNRFVKGKFFASISLNSSYTNNMVVQYVSFDRATGVTSTTSANFGKEYQFGLGFNINTPLNEKLNVGAFIQTRYNHIENKSDILQRNEGISGVAAGNFYYKVVGKFTISGSGGVNRGQYSLTGSPPLNYFYQVNFGYKFLKDKLSVSMNVNNFHARFMNYRTIINHPDLTLVSVNRSPYRIIYFTATYNFGKLKEAVSKKKGVNNDDQL